VAVSQSELRLLISVQDRSQAAVQAAGQAIQKLATSIDQLGQSRGFQQAAQAATQFGSAVQGAARGAASSIQQIGAAYQNMAQQATAAYRQAQAASAAGGGGGRGTAINAAIGSLGPGGNGNPLGALSSAFQAAQQQASSASQSISSSLMAIGNAAKGAAGGIAGGLSAAFNGLQSIVGGAVNGIGSVGNAITNLGRSSQALQSATSSVNSFGDSLRNMLALGASIVGVQSAIGLLRDAFSAIGDAAIGFNSQLENARIAFTSIFQDGQKAQAFIGQLQDFAAHTAFDFPGLLHISQMLVGVGLSAENVIPLMKDVAGAMTAAGRTSADVQGVGLALQQVFTAGKVNAQDMNQLIQRGIPAWTIMAEAIQKTGEPIETAIARVRELGKQGKITSADFFAAFEQYANNHNLAAIAENSVASFSGALSNLGDGFRNLVSSAAEPAFAQISQGIQGLANLLTSAPAKQFGLDLQATLRDALAGLEPLKAALGNVFQGFQAGGISGALSAIVDQFRGLAGDMQDAGAQLMMTYAQGIIQGASDAIQGAVNFVADLIASFLIGNSPPSEGPLANIDQGGRNVGIAWVQGLGEGFQGVEQVMTPIVDAFGRVKESMTIGQVQNEFAGAEGNLTRLKSAAEDAEGAIRTLGQAQRDIDMQQGDLTGQVDAIKTSYGDQIDSLQRAVDLIKDQNTYAEDYAKLIQTQNDAITRQADLQDKQALNALKVAQIQAEGDPVKRAALVSEQEQLKAREADLQLAQRAHDLEQRQVALNQRQADIKSGKTKAGPGSTDQQDIALAQQRIDLDRAQLENAQKLAGLADKSKLADIAAQRQAIENAQATRRINEEQAQAQTEAIRNAAEIERAQKAVQALPLEQQIKDTKRAEEDALQPLQQRLDALQQEERHLSTIRAQWQAIKADIGDATQAQTAAETAAKKAEKAAGGGAGTSALFPNGRPSLERQDVDVAGFAAQAGNSFASAFGASIQANMPKIIGTVLGGVLGASAFGPLGLVAGAYFGDQVAAGVQARVPNIAMIFADAGRTFLQAFAGDWSTDHGDTWVSPMVDAAGRIGIAFRVAADIIAAAWNALKGPVTAAMDAIRQNSGLAAAALTGLLIPAFSALLGIVGAVMAPIIGLLAPLTPAILAVSAAAVVLKAAWDANFGGIQQTVTAAMPAITAALGMLLTAFEQLTQGNWQGALATIGSALGQLGAAIQPILAGIGQAILAAVEGWGISLWQWVVAATPSALAALGQFVADVYAWITNNADGILRGMLAWGTAFAAWIGPAIPPALAALAQLSGQVIDWVLSQIPLLTQALSRWATIFIVWIVTDVIPALPGLLMQVIEVIAGILVAGIPRLLQFGVDMSAAIGNGIMQGLQEAAPGLAEAIQGFIDGASAVWQTIVTTVQDVIAAIVTEWNALPSQAQAVWDAITATWNGAIQAISDALNAAWAGIIAAITAAMAAIQAAIDAAWAAILAAWNATGAAILAAVMAVWNALGPDIQQSLTNLVAAVSALWTALQTLTAYVWNAIQVIITTVMTSIQQYITTGMTTIQTTITTVWTAIQAVWTTVMMAIQATVTAWIATAQSAWTAFTTYLTTLWTTLATDATAIWTTVTTAIQKVLDDWWTTAKGWWDTVMKAITDVWTLLSTTIGPIVKTVMDAIQKQFDDWMTAAKQTISQWADLGLQLATALMDMLTNTVKDKIKGVLDTVTGAVQQITGIINSITGAGKPGAAGTGIDTSGTLQQTAISAARKYSLPPEMFLGQLQQESGFNPNAYNATSGARGVAQFIPSTGAAVAAKMGVDAAKFWADTNLQIEGAAMHMRELLDTYKDYDTALAAYNGGPRAVAALRSGQPFGETSAYIGAVHSLSSGVSIPGGSGQSLAGTPLSRVVDLNMSQFDIGILSNEEAKAACGPYAAWLFARAVGRNPTADEALTLARKFGWTTAGQAGPAAQTNLTNALLAGSGFTASQQAATPSNIDAALAMGSPVQISTPKHFFVARGGTAAGGLDVGKTGQVMGGAPTMTLDQISQLGGGIQSIIVLTGQMGAAFEQADSQTAASVATIAPPLQETTVQTQTLAAQLTAGLAPAGAAAGTSLQQMTTNLDPMLASIAGGTLTTDQLVQQLAVLAANTQLTAGPLMGLTNGSLTAQQAMQMLMDAAAAVDPQFAALSTQMQASDADAQAMAVTFAEGLANSAGNAGAAMTQMQSVIEPVVASVASGQQEGDALNQTLVQLASATGLTTEPFRQMNDGVLSSNDALAEVIQQAGAVSPEFADLAATVTKGGAVSRTTALQFLQMVAAFKQAPQAAQAADTAVADAGQSADAAAQAAQDAVPQFENLSNTMVQSATDGATQYQTALTDGVRGALDAVRGMTGDAESAGHDVGDAIVSGMEAGINDAASKVADAAAKTVKDAVDAAKSAADAHSPSRETMDIGRNMAEGLAIGQKQAGGKAVDAAVDTTGQAIDGMRRRARAHSPSDETRQLGRHMNTGLQLGQTDDAQGVYDAAAGVINGAMDAMQTAAEAHSPSQKAVRIGKDIMKGLEKGLRSSKTSDIAKQQILDYLKVAQNFSDEFATQVDIGVAKLQHEIAGKKRENLEATLKVKDAEEAVQRASAGTYEQQHQLAALGVTQAVIAQNQAKSALEHLGTEKALRDTQQQQERLRAGSLADQQKQATIGAQLADIARQEAEETQRGLAARQQLAAVQQAQAQAAKGSLADQIREADIAERTAQISVQEAQSERDLLPLRNQARDIQLAIQKATQGTVAEQQAAIQAEAQQAASKIEQLKIQDQLALGEKTGGGLSQDQINALHSRDQELQTRADSASRQDQIKKLQATIDTAPDRSNLVAIQDQIDTRTQGLQPVLDEKAALEAEAGVIDANNALQAAGYGHQLVLLQDTVAQHDAIALALTNQKDALDAQNAVITATNEANAAAMNGQIVLLQSQVDEITQEKQLYQDMLDINSAQQAVITTTRDTMAASLQDQLVSSQEILYAQEASQRALERQLEIQQATAEVISTQVALANALKQALTDAGIIKEKTESSSSSKSSSKSKKKKKASGGAVLAGDMVLVGEAGRELFVPPEDGYILNNATTTRMMQALDGMGGRIDSTVRSRAGGGAVWRGRSYLTGDGGGPEAYMPWAPGGGSVPMQRETKIVNANVEYHVHTQQAQGQARVERIVLEAVQFAANS
jgi:tape measure domain-containing protein